MLLRRFWEITGSAMKVEQRSENESTRLTEKECSGRVRIGLTNIHDNDNDNDNDSILLPYLFGLLL